MFYLSHRSMIKNIFKTFSKYKYGLVLSGGAARGFAHLGVIKALHEQDIRPDIISSVSAGSIVGSLYCDGYSPEEILDIFQSKKLISLAEFRFRKNGILRATGLRRLLEKNLRAKTFDDLKLPLIIAATNMRTGRAEYIKKGNLVDTILASSSIPVLFESAKIGNDLYMDGGIVDNLPIEPIQDKCKKIIAVHVNPVGEEKNIKGIVKVAFRSFHLSVAAGVKFKLDNIDIFIEPLQLKDYGLLDLNKSREMFDIGYRHTKKILTEKKEGIRA